MNTKTNYKAQGEATDSNATLSDISEAVDQGDNLLLVARDDPWALLPDKSVCTASYVRHEKSRYAGGGEKLYVVFKIQDLGEHFGKLLIKPYNWYWPAKRGSDLFKDLERLYGKRTSKGTRLPLTLFRNKILAIKVRTVKKNYKQADLPQHQWYSVVHQIMGIAAGAHGSTP